jgi:hypothetical protein
MGFGPADADEALLAYDGDVARAANWLVDGTAATAPPPP